MYDVQPIKDYNISEAYRKGLETRNTLDNGELYRQTQQLQNDQVIAKAKKAQDDWEETQRKNQFDTVMAALKPKYEAMIANQKYTEEIINAEVQKDIQANPIMAKYLPNGYKVIRAGNGIAVQQTVTADPKAAKKLGVKVGTKFVKTTDSNGNQSWVEDRLTTEQELTHQERQYANVTDRINAGTSRQKATAATSKQSSKTGDRNKDMKTLIELNRLAQTFPNDDVLKLDADNYRQWFASQYPDSQQGAKLPPPPTLPPTEKSSSIGDTMKEYAGKAWNYVANTDNIAGGVGKIASGIKDKIAKKSNTSNYVPKTYHIKDAMEYKDLESKFKSGDTIHYNGKVGKVQ